MLVVLVLNLLFLPPGPYLASCLEEAQDWTAAAGLCRINTGCRIPLPLAMLMASVALYVLESIQRPSKFHPEMSLRRHSSRVCRGRPQTWQCSPTVALRWSGLDRVSARARFVGMVEVGGPSRFMSAPSSARCRDRNASFSHEFMTRRLVASFSKASFRSLWNNLLEGENSW
jgi:hypothetical protein